MAGLTITICGCGNGAHACAALMSLKGHCVNIYSPLEDEILQFQRGYDEERGMTMKFGPRLLSGEENLMGEDAEPIKIHSDIKLNKISSNASQVIPDASVIFIITPAFAHRNILESLKPYLSRHSTLVFLPSRGGLELEVRTVIPGVSVLAFQTLPWAVRTTKFGRQVVISGKKKCIMAASIPADLSNLIFCQMELLLDMRIIRLRDIFTLTLSNVGQIIHPGIMYSIFKKDPCATYSPDCLPLFYQGLDEEGGLLLEQMSDEICRIAEMAAYRYPQIETDKVLPIRDWLLASYEGQIADTTSVYKMFITNRAYAGLKAPVRMMEDGRCQPDFSTRYITEDIPYGLLVTKSIAMMLGAGTPAIDEVLTGIDRLGGCRYVDGLNAVKKLSAASRLPESYGIRTIQQMLS